MRATVLGLIVVLAVAIPGCADTTPTRPSLETAPQDALLKTASEKAAVRPVRITGYLITFRRDHGNRMDGRINVVTKGGTFPVVNEPFHGAMDWELSETPVERLEPEAPSERDARVKALAAAKTRFGRGVFAGVEPKLIRYVVEDALGRQFYVTPDGSSMTTAPPFVAISGSD